MKSNLYRLFAMIGVLSLFWMSSGETARSKSPSPRLPVVPSGENLRYLLFLTLPEPQDLHVPAGLTLHQAADFSAGLVWKLSRPVQRELRSLQEQGMVLDFQVLPQQNAIEFQAAPGVEEEVFMTLPGVREVIQADAGMACAQSSANALQAQIFGLSQAQRGERPAPLEVQATDPSIHVYAPYQNDWTYIRGMTTSDTPVSITVRRGSRVLVSGAVMSESDGYYSFFPDWNSGCGEGYSWALLNGDLVEVSAHGSTVQTVVAYLTAWTDPATNIVAGKSDPARSMGIYLYGGADLCRYQGFNQVVPADGSGNFQANFTSQIDFDRRAYASVYAYDANGNSTYAYYDAYHFSSGFLRGSFDGALRPHLDFNATLSRASAVIDTFSGRTDATGWLSGFFSEEIQPNDTITIMGGGVTVVYKAALLDATLDASSNRLSGLTDPGRKVQADFEKRSDSWDNMISTCTGVYACTSTTADTHGNFMLASVNDLARGDFARVYIYDAEGNYQYATISAPVIVGDIQWDEADGYWGKPGVDLNVILKNSSNVVKETRTAFASSYDGGFWTYFSEDIVSGDRIQVGDGVYTETMTVQSLSAQLNNNTEHLAGSTTGGRVLGFLSDYDPFTDGYWEYCFDSSVSGGSYNLDFTGAGVEAQDGADIISIGSDGHYTYAHPHAFEVNADMNEGGITGYTLSPGIGVTVRLWNGSTPVDTKTTTSSFSSGSYFVNFDRSLSPGLRVEVTADLSANVILPGLTINEDAANNRLWGQAPANEPLQAFLDTDYISWKGSQDYWSVYVLAKADAGGNYSASFAGLYGEDWYSGRCLFPRVGSQCARPGLLYFDANENSARFRAPQRSPVAADTFEGDNTSAQAKAYTALNVHTFHTQTDVDWISVTVGPVDVGKTLYLRTVDMGVLSDTVLELYDTNGTTLLDSDDDGGGSFSSLITWTPASTGTYFVKVKPYNLYANTENCGATYSFFVARTINYIPSLLR